MYFLKVLLLNPPGAQMYLRDQYCCFSSKADYIWPPIDLLVQSGILSQEHDVQVIDAIAEKLSPEKCMQRITAYQPDLVLSLTGISSFVSDFQFAQRMKKSTAARIVFSGGFLLAEYEAVLQKHAFIDGILMDYCSDAILRYLRNDEDIPDLAYVKDGKCVLTRSQKDSISYPVPRHELFPLEQYRLPHGKSRPFSCITTNYGCPYQCGFCIAQRLTYRPRRISEIMAELKYLESMGIKEVFIKDFTFGVDRDRTLELCFQMQEHISMSWICASRVDLLDDILLYEMHRAGCHTIQFGVETSNPQLLEEFKAHIQPELVEKTFRLCRRYGIRTLGHFVLGLPGDDRKSIMNTVSFAKKLKCDYASFNIATPLPGTALRKKCIDRGWTAEENREYDLSSGKAAIHTSRLSGMELEQLQKKAYRLFYFRPSYMLRRLFHIRSRHELYTLFKEGLAILKKNIK